MPARTTGGESSSVRDTRYGRSRRVCQTSQKNDANDAEDICEAAGRPNMRFVTLKTVEQQDLQAIHRIRSEPVRQRTAKANQTRGLLAE
ncbi:MAG: transposase [Candidatus Accumulibacter sp.]|nr:transposase [Accumulibacter sp.]